MKFSLVLPFHRDADRLVDTLKECELNFTRHQVGEVLLCHNGDPLDPSMVNDLTTQSRAPVRVLHTDHRGIGAGYKLGITNALCDYVVLSASDLPFGWTDIDAFLQDPCDFAIGSKAHPDSEILGITLSRKVVSWCFYVLRCAVLGSSTPKDSQGSLIVKTELARNLVNYSRFNHYLFSLELASLYLRMGGKVKELPIKLVNNSGESSVSIFSDGSRMFIDLLSLRKSLRKEKNLTSV